MKTRNWTGSWERAQIEEKTIQSCIVGHTNVEGVGEDEPAKETETKQHSRRRAGERWCYGNQKKNCLREAVLMAPERYSKMRREKWRLDLFL